MKKQKIPSFLRNKNSPLQNHKAEQEAHSPDLKNKAQKIKTETQNKSLHKTSNPNEKTNENTRGKTNEIPKETPKEIQEQNTDQKQGQKQSQRTEQNIGQKQDQKQSQTTNQKITEAQKIKPLKRAFSFPKQKLKPQHKDLSSQPADQTSNLKKQASLKETELLKQKENQLEELNKKYQFLMAEYANYKRQSLKQMQSYTKYEGEEFIKKLIEQVMDDFDKAMDQNLATNGLDSFKQGISMIYHNLKKLLDQTQVKELPSKGRAFDPSLHLALSSVEDDSIAPEHIVQVIKKAYTFQDKLIRLAEVIVSKSKEPQIEPDTKLKSDTSSIPENK